jgi:hypothetical protein
MTKHEIKHCPRCLATFECKLNNPVHCGCAAVEIDEDRLLAIAEHYRDCLCADCLGEIAAGDPPAERPDRSGSPDKRLPGRQGDSLGTPTVAGQNGQT